MIILISVVLVATTLGQKLEVHDLRNNQGLLPLKLGTARLIEGHYDLLHIIKLQTYKDTIDAIQDAVDNLHNIDELNSTLTTTKIKLNELKTKLQTLLPRERTKRGIINGLGTVIKFITGNMDANDAERLNKQIDIIMSNQSKLENEINQQSYINNGMIERFENITNHINSQQEIITDYLKRNQDLINNQIKEEHYLFNHFQFLNQINYNIEILHNHLSNIAEAILLAKLNIISKQILSPDELSEVYNILNSQMINIKSDEQLYELLGLQAYLNDTNIIFNIRVPIIRNETYSFFHVIPIPIQKSKILSTKPYVILNPDDIQHFDDKCPEIEKIFYCQISPYGRNFKNSNCITQLIQNIPADCKLIEGDEHTEIYQPEPNYIIFINVPETTINSTCKFSPKTVTGNVLIHYEGCEVQVNGITYKGHPKKFWDEITIHPTFFNKINFTTTQQNITLQKLQGYNFQNRKLIELLQNNTSKKDLLTFILIATQAILISVTAIYTICRLRKSTINITSPAPETEIEPKKVQFVFPSLSS